MPKVVEPVLQLGRVGEIKAFAERATHQLPKAGGIARRLNGTELGNVEHELLIGYAHRRVIGGEVEIKLRA